MSDWLERELARGLTRVNAPEALGERLGLVRPMRSEYRGALAAVAAAVMIIVGGGYAAGQSTSLNLYRFMERDLAAGNPVELASAQTISRVSWNSRDSVDRSSRCAGGPVAGTQGRPANMTALLAHRGISEERLQGSDAGCGFCHSL
jgi:hypothetical protein